MAKKKIEPIDSEIEIDLDGEDIDDLDGLELEEPLSEDDDDALLEDDEDDDESMGATIVRKAGDDEDDDDDMVAPDDVEEDLSKILKDRLASEDLPAEEDEVPESDERSTGDDELQPKRADELLCNSCFLLVRKNAPMCPIGDDACPVFVK
ncbi:MAG: hypothetical protein F2916_00945 [Actinobacteria bacterium]|uniref:Unannotated protein n=1 Tax=freshwater metagenome TaxID=449393 RepID=A0A6J6AF93_9ZZZZ|nr:hypothetical protein [Actinomycetota bacterium]